MRKIIDRKVYDTSTATVICRSGQLNVDGCTRSATLFKTKKGNFFILNETMWQGEHDSITVLTENEAADFYENCAETFMFFEKAFSIKIEEA